MTQYSYSNCMIRPYNGHWAIFHVYEMNRAKVIFEGTRPQCSRKLDDLCFFGAPL